MEQGARRKRTALSTWVIDVGVLVLVLGVVPGLVTGEGISFLAVVGVLVVLAGFAVRDRERKRRR